jgi:hypothetical protein
MTTVTYLWNHLSGSREDQNFKKRKEKSLAEKCKSNNARGIISET